MKKLFGILVMLALALTSCSKNNTVIIEDTSEVVDFYSHSIGLGETIPMRLDKLSTNESVKTLLEKGKLSYNDQFYYVDDGHIEAISIEWTGFQTFELTCIKKFEDELRIDQITIEKEGYKISLPIQIVLTYNSLRDTCFITNLRLYDGVGDREYNSYECFTGASFGYSKEDSLILKDIEMTDGSLDLLNVKTISSESTTSTIRHKPSDYLPIEYPMSIKTVGVNTFFMFQFYVKENVYSAGQDMVITLEINGDIHKVVVYCYFE